MDKDIILSVAEIIITAGKETLRVYDSVDLGVEYKKDNSPLTEADTASHNVIVAGLEKLKIDGSVIPVLSEEGKDIPYAERSGWQKYWLVDPLDGTKEFIKRNGEFTVNIALIVNNEPAAGFVYIPVKDELYFGAEGLGSFFLKDAAETENSAVLSSARALKPSDASEAVKIVASRSHLTPETEDYINKIENRFEKVEIVSSGSSIKLCMVADGSADVYPRFAPTMEWDTAAAHGVCRFAGCRVIDAGTKKELKYNKQNMLNPWFLVYKNNDFAALINQ